MCKCGHCGEDMKLERFIENDCCQEYRSERFVYHCENCMVVASPRFILIDTIETDAQKEILRELYFEEKLEGESKK